MGACSHLQVSGSVGDHLLEGYRQAFISIVAAQFTERRLSSGQPGASQLAAGVDLNRTLLGVNLDLDALRDPAAAATSAAAAARQREAGISALASLRVASMRCGGGGLCGGGGAAERPVGKELVPARDEDESWAPLG